MKAENKKNNKILCHSPFNLGISYTLNNNIILQELTNGG